MKKFDDDEDAISKKYFERIQGQDRADEKPERVSSISPQEYLRREREEKQRIDKEEQKLQKINEITKAGIFSITLGMLILSVAFIGICYICPLIWTRVSSEIVQIAVTIPFAIIALVGFFFTGSGLVRLLTTRKEVEGTSKETVQ